MKAEIGLVMLACALVASNVERSVQAEDLLTPKLGAYDPQGLLARQNDVAIDHVFIDWARFSPEAIKAAVEQAADRGRELMVTVEPWTRAAGGRDGGEHLLAETVRGDFDSEIDRLCGAVGASPVPVTLSWGHEMDETEGRFPWANQPEELYKAAYRHFVDRCRPLASKARFGWTPKGEPDLARYYPGGGYVDVIGLTLFDLQAWNEAHDDRRTLGDKFGVLRGRVAQFGKPIILAEFGVQGDAAYRDRTLSCFRRELHRFPDVEAIVYFNDRETWSWPVPYGRPDWRVRTAREFNCDRPRESQT
jgi:endoglucanase